MIKGTQDKIEKAKQVIEDAIKQAYDRARPTHFLSLPITSTYVTRKLTDFQSSILSSTFKCPGLDPSILVQPANIHITLGVFKLMNQAEIEKAVRFLKEEGPKIVNGLVKSPLTVRLKGLQTMQTNHSNAHVLYVEPRDESTDATKKSVLFELCCKYKDLNE